MVDLHLLDGWVYAVEHICLKLCNNIFFYLCCDV